MKTPRCPICRKEIPLDSASAAEALKKHPHFPFCSERCRMIDLGHWFDESYVISRPAESDVEQLD